jgi:two-component system, OmpR family, sensor histidine kinase KdpD
MMDDVSPSAPASACGELLAAVSHEVRQPLATIRGLTEMLLSHWAEFPDSNRTEMLEAVHHNAERVGRLLDELLEASWAEPSRLVLRRKETDLALLVARVVRDLTVSYPDLKVSAELPAELPKVFVDPFKFEQVLANLLGNAWLHGSPTGIQVAGALSQARGADVVEISVSDTGGGVAPQDLPRVTEQFYRGAGANRDGLGLGLWISKQIVEAHGGHLAASSPPGEGTTLRFTIPLQDCVRTGKLAEK